MKKRAPQLSTLCISEKSKGLWMGMSTLGVASTKKREECMLRRKCSSSKTGALDQLLEIEMNRNKACQSLNSTSWRSAKSTQNPESSLALHGCQKRDLCLSRGSREIPESKAISGNRNNTGPVEKSLLKGKETSRGVAKHAHCLDSS